MPPFFMPNNAMANPLIKAIVRARLRLTSAKRSETWTRDLLKKYLQLAQGLDETTGSEPVTVPPMFGVDPDMRDWSFFMILRHNTLVNREISANVRRLALDEPVPEKKFDIKKDVMPGPVCGIEQIAIFKASVLSHLETLASPGKLRETGTTNHPLFGPFDAHMWNGMFALHLQIHMKQAAFVKNAALKIKSLENRS